MRSVLTARVFDDRALRRRVTVVAGHAPEALDPIEASSVSGFVAAHMLGHLDSATRAGVFSALDRVICDDGVGLVTVDHREPDNGDHGGNGTDTRPDAGAAARTEPIDTGNDVRIGANTYSEAHTWNAASGWTSVYTVRSASGRIVRQQGFAGTWERVTTADLAQDAAPWQPSETDAGVAVLRR